SIRTYRKLERSQSLRQLPFIILFFIFPERDRARLAQMACVDSHHFRTIHMHNSKFLKLWFGFDGVSVESVAIRFSSILHTLCKSWTDMLQHVLKRGAGG